MIRGACHLNIFQVNHLHAMNKSYSSILSSIAFVALFLTGCGGGGGSSSGTSTTKAGAPTSVAGAEIAINPIIKFGAGGSTFTYNNALATESQFPAGLINGAFTTSENNATGELTLTLSAAGFPNDLVLVLSGFLDDGGDGLIDSFSYEATYGTVSITGSGQFTGGKPANPDVDSSSIPDVSGAPTEEEWINYAIGKYIVVIYDDGEMEYLSITDSGNYATTDEEGTEYGTYTYEKLTETTGKFGQRESDDTGWSWVGETTLTFDDFFSGSFQATSSLDTYPNGTTSQDSLTSGMFRIFTDVSFLSD